VYAQEYQELSAQAAAFHARFVQAMAAAAGWYTNAETAAASLLQSYQQQVLDFVNTRLLGGARPGTGGGAKNPDDGSTGGGTTGGGTTGGGTTGEARPAAAPPAAARSAAARPAAAHRGRHHRRRRRVSGDLYADVAME